MRARWGGRTTSAVAAATVLVVGLSAWAIAAIPGPDGEIRGCVGPGGLVRIVDPESTNPALRSCRRDETPVQWSQRGPAGTPGADGSPGPRGAEGPPGRSVCKAEDLLLCLPDRPDLQPRLTVDGEEVLRGEAYRAELEHELVEFQEGGQQGPIFGRNLVKRSEAKIVLVGGLARDADKLLRWFQEAGAGLPQARRNATFELHDGTDVVFDAFLVNAMPTAIKVDEGRVQVTLDFEELILASG